MPTNIATIKKYFDTAVEVKKRYEAVNLLINMIEDEIRYTLSSSDFMKLPKSEREHMITSRARAAHYWKIQLSDYMDENLSAWVNVAAKARSTELDVTMEQAVKEYMISSEHRDEILAEDLELPEEMAASEEEESDEDLLESMIASQT